MFAVFAIAIVVILVFAALAIIVWQWNQRSITNEDFKSIFGEPPLPIEAEGRSGQSEKVLETLKRLNDNVGHQPDYALSTSDFIWQPPPRNQAMVEFTFALRVAGHFGYHFSEVSVG